MVQSPVQLSRSPIAIPPLENVDRLSRLEFERRYAAMPESCRAELIEGLVYIAAAVRFNSHAKPHSQLNHWMGNYSVVMPGTTIGDAPSVQLDDDNEPQPDIVMIWDADHGGQTNITGDDYIEGAPELVAEIAASTVSIELDADADGITRSRIFPGLWLDRTALLAGEMKQVLAVGSEGVRAIDSAIPNLNSLGD